MFIKTTKRFFLAASLAAAAALPTAAAAQDRPSAKLSSPTNKMSIRDGGIQMMHLDAGQAQAGRWFLILGSVTGTNPGVRLGEFTIPLNYDVYTNFTLSTIGRGLIVNQLGRLGADGKAMAGFALPPKFVPRSLVGLKVHHAYVTANESGGIGSVSNPVSVKLVD